MKTVEWNDFPALCLELVDEVKATGLAIEITRNGVPALRLEPIDDVTRSSYESMHAGLMAQGEFAM